MPTPRAVPFDGSFKRLSPSVFYKVSHAPVKPSGKCVAQEPHLILITAWLNAATEHINIYLAGLKRIFPTSRILLVTTSSIHFLQGTAKRTSDLQPAVDILQNVSPNENVLLYSFSNAGATSAYLLARAIQAQSGRGLPLSKIFFDSAPGDSSYFAVVRAFAAALPRVRLVREICMSVLYVIFGAFAVWKAATGYKDILERMQKGLNDPLLFPPSAARMYVYSTADQMVPWQAVEGHAGWSRSLGYRIYTLRLFTTGHVAHVAKHGVCYWEAMEQLWDSDYLSAPGRVTLAW